MKVYVSHPIRGIHREKDTDEQAIMDKNNLMARIFGMALRVKFPQHEFYVPAEHEEFVVIAYRRAYMAEGSILDVDCQIIDTKDGLIFYNHQGELSNGMHTEREHACATGKPHAIISSLSLVADLPELEELLKCN